MSLMALGDLEVPIESWNLCMNVTPSVLLLLFQHFPQEILEIWLCFLSQN